MKHGHVVFDFLVPANENASKPIHPTVRPFYHPAACFGAGISFKFLGFFSAATNVSREAKLPNDFSNLIKVIAFIHAHALLVSRCPACFRWWPQPFSCRCGWRRPRPRPPESLRPRPAGCV